MRQSLAERLSRATFDLWRENGSDKISVEYYRHKRNIKISAICNINTNSSQIRPKSELNSVRKYSFFFAEEAISICVVWIFHKLPYVKEKSFFSTYFWFVFCAFEMHDKIQKSLWLVQNEWNHTENYYKLIDWK